PAAAADLDEIIAVARALEDVGLLLRALAGERVVPGIEQRGQLRLARGRDRELRDHLGARSGPGAAGVGHRVAGNEDVAPEYLARKEHAAGEAERRIEVALEGGLEARDLDAKRLQQPLGDVAVERLGRLQRLAAAVADDESTIEHELVAL